VSNHLITAAYKADLATPMRKSVMVLLADKASDDGSGIWASKQTMADELCCSKQAVITTIKAFLAEGLLVVEGQRKSPTGYTNCYAINVEKLKSLTLVKCWADKERGSTSLTGQPPLPVNEDYGRGQPPLPKPSRTPLVDKANALPTKRAREKSEFVLPDWVPADAWAGFEEMRRSIRKPMTDRARTLIIRELEKLRGPPGDILDQSTRNNWQGVFELKGSDNGNAGNRQADGMGRTERAAMQALRDLGLAPAESEGSGSDGQALPAARRHAAVRGELGALLPIGHVRSGSG